MVLARSRHQLGRLPCILQANGRGNPLHPEAHPRRLQLSCTPRRTFIRSAKLWRPSSLPFVAPLVSLRQPHSRRSFSTEQQESSYYQKFYAGFKVALSCYALVLLYHVIELGVYQEKIERAYPTPREWSLWSRWRLRSARALSEEPGKWGHWRIDWPKVGQYYEGLLERLENETIDGKGLQKVDDGDGHVIYDVSRMTEPWKEGYFQALMGAASSAEKLEGWVRDTKSGSWGPRQAMRGPSNPNPTPTLIPGENPKELHEENCVPAYQSPELFYRKVLSTSAFKSNQKLDAALAYADWLDYKGLSKSAEEVYATAMEISTAEFPDSKSAVDIRTGILRNSANVPISDNLLRTSTAIGKHNVQIGDLKLAFSIFLSVLKTRRDSPEPTALSPPKSSNAERGDQEAKDESLISKVMGLLSESPYQLSPLTGNEPATKSIESPCEEAALMLYIGELLFAGAFQASKCDMKQTQSGLAWTRDAADVAESTTVTMLTQMDEDNVTTEESFLLATDGVSVFNRVSPYSRCTDCLRAGLTNWLSMVSTLLQRTETEELSALDQARAANKLDWLLGWSARGWQRARQDRRRWEAEKAIVSERIARGKMLLGDPMYQDVGLSSIWA